MKGMVYIDPDGIAEDSDLKKWVGLCEKFVESLPPKGPKKAKNNHERIAQKNITNAFSGVVGAGAVCIPSVYIYPHPLIPSLLTHKRPAHILVSQKSKALSLPLPPVFKGIYDHFNLSVFFIFHK